MNSILSLDRQASNLLGGSEAGIVNTCMCDSEPVQFQGQLTLRCEVWIALLLQHAIICVGHRIPPLS